MKGRPKRTRVLLLLGYYVREIHHGVAAYACEAGWRLDASMAHFGVVPDDWKGEGIITFSADRPDIVGKIAADKVPTVEMFNGAALPGIPQVLIDNLALGRMAGDYLVSRGFQNIGYYFFDPELANLENEAQRSRGLHEAVLAAGRNYHEVRFNSAMEAVRRLPKPLALMAQNDLVGERLIHLLIDAGFRVPQDVAVIGVGTDALYQAFSPVAQTSVDSNIEYQGYAAAELLHALIRGETPPGNPVMIPPVRVVERASTSLLTSSVPTIDKALAFIRDHLADGIGPEHVAAYTGLGRYQLNEHFKRHVGDSLSKHMLRVRIDRAREMLVETDDKIHAMAMELGFKSAAYFTTVFQSATGLTPGEFRKRARIRGRQTGGR